MGLIFCRGRQIRQMPSTHFSIDVVVVVDVNDEWHPWEKSLFRCRMLFVAFKAMFELVSSLAVVVRPINRFPIENPFVVRRQPTWSTKS